MIHSGRLFCATLALLAFSINAQITGYTNVFPWYGSCKMKPSENLFQLGEVSVGAVMGGYQRICWTVDLNEECPLTIDGLDNPCCKGYMEKGAFVEANVYKLELAHKAQCRNHIEYGVGPHGPRLVKVDGSETNLKMNWEVYRLPNGNMANKVRFTGMDLTRANGAGAQICYSVKAGVCTGLDNLCPTPGCKGSATLIEMDNSYRHQCCPITTDEFCKDLLPGGVCPAGSMTKPGVNLNTFVPVPATAAAALEQCCQRMTCDDYMAAGQLYGRVTDDYYYTCPLDYDGAEWNRNNATYGNTVEECCDKELMQLTPQRFPFPYCRCEGQFIPKTLAPGSVASGDGYMVGDNVVENVELYLPFRLSTNYSTSTHEGRPLYCFDLQFLGTVPAPAKPTIKQWCRAQSTLHRVEFLSKPECTKKDFDTWFRMRDTGAMIQLSTEDQTQFNEDGSPHMNTVFNPYNASTFQIQRSAVKVIKIQQSVEAAGYNWASVVGANVPRGGRVSTIGAVCLQPKITGGCTNLREICGSSGDGPDFKKYFAYRGVEPPSAVELDSVRCEWSLLESGNQRCCPTQTELVVPPPL